MEKVLSRKPRVSTPLKNHLKHVRKVEDIPSLPVKKIIKTKYPEIIMPPQPSGYIKARKNDCL